MIPTSGTIEILSRSIILKNFKTIYPKRTVGNFVQVSQPHCLTIFFWLRRKTRICQSSVQCGLGKYSTSRGSVLCPSRRLVPKIGFVEFYWCKTYTIMVKWKSFLAETQVHVRRFSNRFLHLMPYTIALDMAQTTLRVIVSDRWGKVTGRHVATSCSGGSTNFLMVIWPSPWVDRHQTGTSVFKSIQIQPASAPSFPSMFRQSRWGGEWCGRWRVSPARLRWCKREGIYIGGWSTVWGSLSLFLR